MRMAWTCRKSLKGVTRITRFKVPFLTKPSLSKKVCKIQYIEVGLLASVYDVG